MPDLVAEEKKTGKEVNKLPDTTNGLDIEIVKVIKSIESQLESLQIQEKMGIINASDAGIERDMLNQKERMLKERLVSNQHLTADGTPRAISHHEPTDDNPKEYWITRVADGKKMKAATRDALIDKLYEYYLGGECDLTVKSVFKAALLEKAITENPKQNTLAKNEADFRRYISPALAGTCITKITETDLKKYIQEWVNRDHPKKKAFLDFKGVLNLIFGYAYMHKLIPQNPLDFVKNKPYMKSCDTRKAKPSEKILSPEEIEALKSEVRRRMGMKKYGSYYINGYAMLFAIETGVRVGELCALKWSDIETESIHIHSQQLTKITDGAKEYYLVPYTKNEKGESEDGRDFPLTRKLKALLSELKGKQDALGIDSEFVFCHEDGEWIKTDAYITFLRRLCTSKGFNVTNNHALRMSLNSNVLIPMGISPADRAAMLGHSIETNLKYYSFAQKDYIGNVRAILDAADDEGTQGNPGNLVHFPKKESPEALISQGF